MQIYSYHWSHLPEKTDIYIVSSTLSSISLQHGTPASSTLTKIFFEFPNITLITPSTNYNTFLEFSSTTYLEFLFGISQQTGGHYVVVLQN